MGFGHISRCLAIARHLTNIHQSIEVALFTPWCQAEVARLAHSVGVNLIFARTFEDIEQKISGWSDVNTLVVDDWFFSAFNSMNDADINFALIVQPHIKYPRSFLDQTAHLLSCSVPWFQDPQLQHYKNKTIHCGPILNLSVQEEKLTRAQARSMLDLGDEFVISILAGGGSYGLDLNEMVNNSIDSLIQNLEEVKIFHLIGPHASFYNVDGLQSDIAAIVKSPLSVYPYFKGSDIVIGQAGYQTMMELMYAGTSSVLYKRGREQEDNYNRFSSSKFQLLESLDWDELQTKIGILMQAQNIPTMMFRNGVHVAANSIFKWLNEL